MAEGEYHLVFRGELTGTVPEETVRDNLAQVFRMSRERVAALFGGKPVVIKRNVDEATARKFEAAFRKAGAVCELHPVDDGSTAPEAGSDRTAGAATAAETAVPAGRGAARGNSIAAAGDPNQTLREVEVPADVGDLALDDSDRPLQSAETPATPDIDISGLGLANDAGPLSQAEKPGPPKIDTSGLDLEPPES